jgi:starch synthase
MQVLSVTSECVPLIKTGGLADVAGALPEALAGAGVQMRTLIPAYTGLIAKLGKTRVVWRGDLFGGPAKIVAGKIGEAEILAVDAPHLYNREGGPYLDGGGSDHSDNPQRFAALCRAAVAIAKGGLDDGWTPDLVHAHDWQGALAPVYLQAEGIDIPSVLTIHNIAFQGLAHKSMLNNLDLPQAMWEDGTLEFWDQINVLKAGIVCATRVTTVSPSYAIELQRERFGMGLHGVINARADGVRGILNGIDDIVWNPEIDAAIVPYSAKSSKPKAKNRTALLREFGLTDTGGPLAIVVSRLTDQKGLDLLPDALTAYAEAGGMMAILGTGDAVIEARLRQAAERLKGQVAIKIGYDEGLSHRMFAGADAVVIPSRFEPCGLTQLYGLRYGAVPVVAATGGLADTVIPASPAALGAGVATGVMMRETDELALHTALCELIRLYGDTPTFAKMRKNGMIADFGWARSAAAYAALYNEIIK